MGDGQSAQMEFVGDDALSYDRNRYRGGRLELDRSYRLMHLPLVNPDHPDILPASEDGEVAMGRFGVPRKSLVAFLDWSVFQSAPPVGAMIDSVAASSIAGKVDFTSFDKRKDRLHFTVSALQSDAELKAVIDAARGMQRFKIQVGGLWAGASVNTGRFYLPVYPERKDNENVLNLLQGRAGLSQSDFFGMGFFNLTDDLDFEESAALLDLVEAAVGQRFFTAEISELAVIETFDSLLLDYRIAHRVSLI